MKSNLINGSNHPWLCSAHWVLAVFLILGTAGASAAGNSYILGAGDKIKIHVYGEEDLSLETLVDNSETISYPFLGTIQVGGMTPLGLEKRITHGLKGDYLVDPEVTVSVLQFRKFFVKGWVENPGGFPFEPGMTVRKAISLAGGFQERADREAITIVRDAQPDAEPQPVGPQAQVKPGDTINVGRSFF